MQNLTYRDLVLTGVVVAVENTDVIGLFFPFFVFILSCCLMFACRNTDWKAPVEIVIR